MHIMRYRRADGPDGWYKDLYIGLSMRARAIAIKRGEPIESIQHTIRRRIAEGICKYYVELDTPQGYMCYAVMSLQRSCIGRSGEIAYSNWNAATWDYNIDSLQMWLILFAAEIGVGVGTVGYLPTLQENCTC